MSASAALYHHAVTASLSGQLTHWVGRHGVYAVFILMAIDSLLPLGGELTMLYGGALAGGAFATQRLTLFGAHPSTGVEGYIVVVAAGTLGYLLGSIAGWLIGKRGGRPLVERHGRLLHLPPENFHRAERWFDRRGAWAVFLGRLTPLVRSFVSIPAGVLGIEFGRYVAYTLAASLIWCLAFAAVGWAVGGSWDSFHHGFRYADYTAVAVVVLGVIAAVLVRRRMATRRPSP